MSASAQRGQRASRRLSKAAGGGGRPGPPVLFGSLISRRCRSAGTFCLLVELQQSPATMVTPVLVLFRPLLPSALLSEAQTAASGVAGKLLGP